MSVTAIDWTSLLAMLGSDKSIAYWEAMRIPVKLEDYEAVSKSARACLEFYIFSYIKSRPKDTRLLDAWNRYSLSEPILEEGLLRQDGHWPPSDEGVRRTADLVNKALGVGISNEIFDWAETFFRSVMDPAFETSIRLGILLRRSKEINFEPDRSLSESHLSEFEEFCNGIKWKHESLREHFSIASNVYRMTLPTKWEMLLQDCFFESVRTSFWWMDSVEFTMQYLFFHKLWNQLREELTGIVIETLLSWFETNQEAVLGKSSFVTEAHFRRLRELGKS